MLPKISIDLQLSRGSYVMLRGGENRLLDMVNHYSSNALGYNHPVFRKKQFIEDILDAATVKNSNGIYDTVYFQEFFDYFKVFCGEGFAKFHFCNTGSLAIEAAIKTAIFHRKQKIVFADQIFYVEKSFHGINSLGNFIGTTGNRTCPSLILANTSEGHISYAIDQSTDISQYDPNEIGCIIVEPIQCSAGDIFLDTQWLRAIRTFCTQQNIPLIFDEIQTGFGATGKVWYHQVIDIEPDILVFGKKAQVSGIMVKEPFSGIFSNPEKLSVTFDGDLIDMIRCKYVIQAIDNYFLLSNIKGKGQDLRYGLGKLECIELVRGIGGLITMKMQSCVIRDLFVEKALKNGLYCNPTGLDMVRLRPNLAVTEAEVADCINIVSKTLSETIKNQI